MVSVNILIMTFPLVLSVHPHTYMTTDEIIRARGYPVEKHKVITDDGYIIEMHRIPGGRWNQQSGFDVSVNQLRSFPVRPKSRPLWRSNHIFNNSRSGSDMIQKRFRQRKRRWLRKLSTRQDQPVVFLQHGVVCSSADFVMNDPDQALGFILADLGYDVWLGNVRGNTYGRKHTTLSPEDPMFWDFSFDTIAKYDVPAMLSYVKANTGVDQLDYIGHSMGTTVFFAMMNYHPHINFWIRKMAALAPSAYIHNTFLGFKILSPVVSFFNKLKGTNGSQKKHDGSLLTLSRPMKAKISSLCDPSMPTHKLCKSLVDMIGGPSYSNSIDEKYLPVILAHTPAGGSYNIIAHYSQLILARKFQAYDYGWKRNLQMYGKMKPPPFSLGVVTAPVGLFWSQTDWINRPPDVKRIADELPKVIYNHKVKLPMFNHLDFVWGEKAHIYVYRPLIQFLAR